MRATEVSELALVSSEVHDEWFDLDAFGADSNASELRIDLLGRGSRAPTNVQAPTGILSVRHLIDWRADDEAGIRWYTVRELVYDTSERVIALRSSFPLVVTLRVSELDVTLTRP
jgi:hypothetical protein